MQEEWVDLLFRNARGREPEPIVNYVAIWHLSCMTACCLAFVPVGSTWSMMRHLRPVVALLLAASVGGLQAAAASCVMGTFVAADAAATGEASHSHHSSDTSHQSEPSGSDTHNQTTPPVGCGLMMACSAAAPTSTIATPASGPFTADPSTAVRALAYISPSADFEPPPPRQILI